MIGIDSEKTRFKNTWHENTWQAKEKSEIIHEGKDTRAGATARFPIGAKADECWSATERGCESRFPHRARCFLSV